LILIVILILIGGGSVAGCGGIGLWRVSGGGFSWLLILIVILIGG